MRTSATRRGIIPVYTLAVLLLAGPLTAEQVPVRLVEGRIRGFLVLRDTGDKLLATGELTQVVNGIRVTNELNFRFKDGSTQQEIAVFSQRRVFQLLTYRLVQKGGAFKRPTNLSLNVSTGAVTIRYTDDDGKEKTIDEHMKLPPDLANGILPTLMSDIDPKSPKTTLSMLVSTPKPRLVKLEVMPAAEENFTIGGSTFKALRYVVKIDLGGIAGVNAPVVGKQPPDIQFWVAVGKAPGFLKSEGPLFVGGPIWRIELASPVWPKGDDSQKR